MDGGISIAAFGRFSAIAGGEERAREFSPRSRRCLAHLVLSVDALDRGLLAARLWPEVPDATALGNLRRRLHELERAFQRIGLYGAIERSRGAVALTPAARAVIDVARYVKLAQDRAGAGCAVQLYAEPLFPGIDDDVLSRERRRLHAIQLDLLEHLLDRAIAGNDARRIAAIAQSIEDLEPLSEQSVEKAVTALERLGELDRARRLSQRLAQALHEDLDGSSRSAVRPVASLGEGVTAQQRRQMRRTLEPLIAQDEALRGAAAARHFDRVAAQIDEIRAALDAAICRRDDVELGTRALAALSRFLFDRGYASEAFAWYEAAIPLLPPSRLRAEALYLSAVLGRNLGWPEHGLPAFERAIDELRAFDDRVLIAKAMLYASNAARMTGRVRLARDWATRAFDVLQHENNPYLVAFARSALGTAAYALGDIDLAQREFELARDTFAQLDARDDEALMIVDVARCRFARGEGGATRAALEGARASVVASANAYVEGHATIALALLCIDEADASGARRYLARAAAIASSNADTELQVIALEAAAELFALLGEPARARDALAAADGVRASYLISRAPSEYARSERLRSELECQSLQIRSNGGSPGIMMRALLESVARSYARDR